MSVARIEKSKIWEIENGVCRPWRVEWHHGFCASKEKCFKVEKSSVICFYKHPVPHWQCIQTVPWENAISTKYLIRLLNILWLFPFPSFQ